jgi:hypothetical protein
MAVISKQELQDTGKWWTWVNYEGFNTFIYESADQITEQQAVALKDKYLDDHLYDGIPQVVVNLYENREVLRDAIVFIKTTDPTLNQWNAYLAILTWDNALAVRWFLAKLAQALADRKEIDLGTFTETEVLSRLKTWIIAQSPRRLEKVLFGG